MTTLTIYRPPSTEIVTINIDEKTIFQKRLMAEHVIKCEFIYSSVIGLQIGDFITYNAENYYINRLPDIEKINNTTYKYTIVFESVLYDLNRKLFISSDGLADYSYNGSTTDFVTNIVASINTIASGWSVGTVNSSDDITLQFSNESCRTALSRVAEAFSMEFSLSGKAISLLNSVGNNTAYRFEYGKGLGLYKLTRQQVSDQNILTKVYGFGATTNIPSTYRDGAKRLTFAAAGMAASGYLVSASSGLYGVIEGQFADDNIYPHRTGTLTGVNYTAATGWNSNTDYLVDSAMDFDINNYLIEGQTATIVFKSGDNSGVECEIWKYVNATKRFYINPFKEANGYIQPNALNHPASGDSYTLVNISMPASYVTTAETALQTATQTFLNENSAPMVVYSVDIDPKDAESKAISLNVGDKVTVVDTGLSINSLIRVSAVEFPLVNPYQIKATIADFVPYTLQERIVKAAISGRKEIVFVDRRRAEQARRNTVNQKNIADAMSASPVFTTQITTPLIYGSAIADGDITIRGTSHATRDTSYVILQDTGGNVGIRTTTPTANLQIGDITDSVKVVLGGPNSSTYSSELIFADSGADSPYYDGMSIAYNSLSNTLNFWDNYGRTHTEHSGTLMSIGRDTGFLGLGTGTPNRLITAFNDTYPVLSLGKNTSNVVQLSYENDYGSLQSIVSGVAGKLTLNEDGGNVGIGFTAPLSKVCINGGLHIGGESDAGDNNCFIDGFIGTADYVSQATGWNITQAGAGDFRYLYADEMHVKSFIADLEQALAGGQIICKSVAPLAAVFTIPAAGANATLVVESFRGFDTFKVFVNGDIIRLRQFSRAGTTLSITNCWGTVVHASTDTDANTQTYTFTRSAAPNAGAAVATETIGIGTLALDYGTTGNGFLESNSIDGAMAANSPYHQVGTWTTHPATGTTIRTRLGNLVGIPGQTGYGLVTRKDNDNYVSQWWTADNNWGIRGVIAGDEVFTLGDANVIAGFTISFADGLYAGAGATRVQMKPGAGFWAGATAIGDAPFSVTEAGALTALGAAKIGTSTRTVEGNNQAIAIEGPDIWENALNDFSKVYINRIGYQGGTTKSRGTIIGDGLGHTLVSIDRDGMLIDSTAVSINYSLDVYGATILHNTLAVTGISTFTGLIKTVGGVHIGGTSNPGTDNLLVDGRVGIGALPRTAGALEITSTTGTLIVSRMTAAQIAAMTPTAGMIVYQTNGTNGFYGYTNAWRRLD